MFSPCLDVLKTETGKRERRARNLPVHPGEETEESRTRSGPVSPATQPYTTRLAERGDPLTCIFAYRRSGPLQLPIGQAYVANVLEGIYPVESTGPQTIVTLPDSIDLSNAGSVGEELLAVINRGAAALIVDMTATTSCDYAGAEALVRAYRRVVASNTQLRLVVPAEVVRRVLSLTGLDRLVSVYPSREAAMAAGLPAERTAAAAGPPQVSQDLLAGIVRTLFHAGLSLQAALDAAHEADRQHITDALQYVDEAIREIRDHVFLTRR